MSKEFIEVLRVVNDGGSINMGSRPEVLDIADIKSFREWHKGKNDKFIPGDMTMLILEPKKQVEETVLRESDAERVAREKKVSARTWLIEENYRAFKKRLALEVVIKQLVDE